MIKKDKKKQKENYRKKRWAKRVCLRLEQYDFLKNEMSFLKYKTIAGTLDYIINLYKNKKI